MTNALTTPSFWDKTVGQKRYPSPFSRMDRELKRIFRSTLIAKRGGNILEMGCGNSYWLPWFTYVYGMDVYGIDYSLPRLDWTGRNYTANTGMYANLSYQDFNTQVEGWLGKMDVVYSGGVVEHFHDSARLLELFAGYLKPDGILITTAPHLKGFWGELGQAINKEAADGYKRLDLADLEKAHTDAGLKIMSSNYFRWGDAHILNFENWPFIPRAGAYMGIECLDLLVGMFSLPFYKQSAKFYSDMVVIAKC